MSRWRAALPLLLALILAGGSVATVLARAGQAGQHHVVLCTGTGVKVVTLDAEGKPAGPDHPCPDCLAAAKALPAASPFPTPAAIPRSLGRVLAEGPRLAARSPLPSCARDPPFAV